MARRLILLLMTWMVTGCAAATGLERKPDTLYGELRGCAPEEFTAELPSAAVLVDTSSLNPALREVHQTVEVEDASVTLTMWYEPDGLNIRRDVVRHTLSPVVADSVQGLVFATLREVPEREEPWGVRLEIDMANGIVYGVDRREYCPPRPLDLTIKNAIQRIPFSGPRIVLLDVLVHPAGYVEDATIIRGASAGGILERDLLTYIRRFSFEPARIDGVPAFGRIVVPVRVRE